MMKKLISLALVLCVALMLMPAMADEDVSGAWYADYYGGVMTLRLNEDGTCSLEFSGATMAAGTWTAGDGTVAVTMANSTDEASTLTATLADGVLTLADEDMAVDFTREPIEAWVPAEMNPKAAAEDFEGEWAIAKVSMMGMTLDAASVGMGDMTIKVENGAVSFGGSADSLTSFVGDEALAMAYEDGVMSYSVDIPNDAEPITLDLWAMLLKDGMLCFYTDMGFGVTEMYFTRVAAEEIPAA